MALTCAYECGSVCERVLPLACAKEGVTRVRQRKRAAARVRVWSEGDAATGISAGEV